MKDFYNNELEAVGICKICNKGLSKKSLLEAENAIVCNCGDCFERNKKINEINDLNIKNIANFKSSKFGKLARQLFFIGMGLIFLGLVVYEYIKGNYIDYFSLSAGILFTIFGVYMYLHERMLLKGLKK